MRSLHASPTLISHHPATLQGSKWRPLLLSLMMGIGLILTTVGMALGAAMGVALVLDLLH